jgi:hypothetical protein
MIINFYQIESYTLLEEIYEYIKTVNIQSYKNLNYVYYQNNIKNNLFKVIHSDNFNNK